MKRTNLIGILKAGVIFIILLAFVLPGPTIIGKQFIASKAASDNSIDLKQTQELIQSQKAVLLNIMEDRDNSDNINGAIDITMLDLECGSCIRNRLNNYDTLIIYSKDISLQAEASELLKLEGYNVYELTETPITDFLISHDIFERIDIPSEKQYSIKLRNINTRVGVYEHEGRIKRLYGEAFSQGDTPEESAEAFIESNANLFGIEPEDLEYQNTQPIMYDSDTDQYKFYGVNYVQYKNGIPVFRTRLILLVRNVEGYPLVLVSSDLRNLNGFIPLIGHSKLNPERRIAEAMKVSPNLINFGQTELVIWAGINDMIVEPTLSYSFIGENDYVSGGRGNSEKELFIADAETGEIQYQENLILSIDVVGNVHGKATQGVGAEHCEEELPEPMKYARVNIGGTIAYTDENGDFVIPNPGSEPVDVESRLRGMWFRVYNSGGSDAVLYAYDVIPPGPVYFMHNEPNTDEFYRAQVNGYLQSNVVRDFTLTYNPAYPGLQQQEFPVYVNINDYCNAYYDYSSINFFRAGGGCPNTAYSTIVHHEYGHHLVSMAGSGQGAYGEGMGDTMGVLILDNPGLAYGFYGDCEEPMRNADNDMQYPCSGEIHYCGQLLSGCVWSTRNELLITNPDDYLDIISNLAVNAMLLHTGDSIDPSITIDYLTLDDDNGNIYDGTPHYAEIDAGFSAHNMDAPDLILLAFDFPNGHPEIILPEGGTSLRVEVTGVIAEPEPGTGVLYFNDGSGWEEIPMNEIENNIYDAIFPDTNCGDKVSYYFSANTTEGETQYWPMDAPEDVFYTVAAFDFAVVFSDDFEIDKGWTVENDPYLTTGEWERGIPIGGGDRGDPPTDYDGSGQCYLTDNSYGDSDVDDGITWLISPTLDVSDGANARIDYALWYTNNYGNDPNNDYFKVYVSNNDGADWILAETIGPQTPVPVDWYVHSIMVRDFVTPSNQVKVRFEASDLYDGSVVEAGIDAINITIYDCEGWIPPADLDCDGTLHWTDVQPGEIVTGSFEVENIGEPLSELNWEISEWPEWGTWTFDPDSGTNLPQGESITIDVEVEAPDDQNEDFEGEVTIVNLDDPEDICTIQVSLSTPTLSLESIVLQFLKRTQ